MPPNAKYLLVSLPTSIAHTHDANSAFAAIGATVNRDCGTVHRFPIPEFKIGTLDALVLQADELAKLDTNVEGAVAKVVDVLRGCCVGAETEEEEVEKHKMVNDKSADDYLRGFSWNKVKYRSDKSIAQLLESLHKEVVSLDADVKEKFSAYQQVKSALLTVQRKQTGNLSTRSLASILKKSDFIPPSEYLETRLIAVPRAQEKAWLKSYETLIEWVVPRSSREIARDADFVLYTVVVFQKYGAQFSAKARAQKYIPRDDFKWTEGIQEEEGKEAKDLQERERKLLGETLRLARTGYSDLFQAWIHVKALRVFVESVLRYGLPLDFVSVVIHSNAKLAKKAKTQLDAAYSYLGGNAFGKDSKGNIKDDVGEIAAGMLGGGEYPAYCYFEFEVI